MASIASRTQNLYRQAMARRTARPITTTPGVAAPAPGLPGATVASGGAYDPYKTYADDAGDAELALDRYTKGMGQIGAGASAEGYRRTLAFDPTQAIKTYAKGAWDAAVTGQGGLNDQLQRLREQSVAEGRFDSGFFDEDQGQVVRSVANDYQNKIAQQAVTAAQMQQQNNAQLYGIGESANDQYTSGLSARIEERRAKAAAKKKRRSAIAGALAGVLGGVVGGPAGAAIGGSLGGALFS